MALNKTHFDYADRGATSVYKFRFGSDPGIYVWFGQDDGKGSLHTTPTGGPYRVEHELGDAGHKDLDALLAAKGIAKDQWVKDLMAQYGESLGWTYP